MSARSRSTVLQPLEWLVGLTLGAVVLAVQAKAPSWLLVTLVIASLSEVGFFFATYVFLLLNDRDALRSERFGLGKMALEKGIMGDNISGIVLPTRAATIEPAQSRDSA